MFLRTMFTLARQTFVGALYLVSLSCILVAYAFLQKSYYWNAFLLGIIVPAIAIALHILIAKYLKKYDVKFDKEFEGLRKRNNSINRLIR